MCVGGDGDGMWREDIIVVVVIIEKGWTIIRIRMRMTGGSSRGSSGGIQRMETMGQKDTMQTKSKIKTYLRKRCGWIFGWDT